MAHFLTFDHLSTGQYVKIAGKTTAQNGFVAVEIVLEPAEVSPKLEGEVQAIDAANRTLQTFNRDLPIGEKIEITDSNDNVVELSRLQAGAVLKIKGSYVNGQGFVPKKIKLKPALEFNIEEMQGTIEQLDTASRTLHVNGVTVTVNDKTIFQAS